ncbi:hypothetical protein [Roseomonas rosulenta]|uniref:hypothetical protein n=1 Tax=Roseomonas rosulenta TaxID=2748667 RepID=UPI0018E0284A|nr:hypothetical protein [Roseomonas rosulenta]
MLELIALICAAVFIVWTPIEARRVAGGWVRARHKGTPEQFRIQYRKQLTLFIWVGIVLGLGNLGLTLLPGEDPARMAVKVVAGLLWLGAAGAAVYGRRVVDAAPR